MERIRRQQEELAQFWRFATTLRRADMQAKTPEDCLTIKPKQDWPAPANKDPAQMLEDRSATAGSAKHTEEQSTKLAACE